MSFQPSAPDDFPSADQGERKPAPAWVIQIPGYEIECEIGRGGMATVYRAVQQSLSRQVAIKVLARGPDDDDEFAQRFKKEGRILAQLLHPNIVTIYDIGVSENNQLFLSMEYLSGGTLRDRIKLGLSFDSAIHIIRSIAKALGYAHEKGVIHRDVKPSNIMFRHDGAPVLTDFGVARVVAGSNTVRTLTGLTVGSPGYMSPEQAMGQGATIQSDLYSLGVVLYEMLAGHPPYQADNSLAVVLKHLHDAIPRLPREHANLQPILNKLLAKKPTDRFRDTSEFLKAFNIVIPSDTGSRPGSITGSDYLDVLEFTSGKIKSLFQESARLSNWIWVIGTVIFLILVVYIFRFRYSTESFKTLPEPQKPVATTAPMSRETEIETLLQQAEAQLKSGLLTDEADQSAEAAYRQVLKLDRGNVRALAGLEAIANEYERLARQRLESGAPQESLDQLKKGLAVAPGREGLMRLRQEAEQRIAERQAQITEQKRQQELQLQAEQFLAQARSSFEEGLLEISLVHIEQGLLAAPDHPDLSALREQVKARMAEQARQQAEATRRQEEEARRHAEETERRKTERALQQAAAERRWQEADQVLAQAVEFQQKGDYAASGQLIEKGLEGVPNHEGLLHLREEVRAQRAAEQQRQAEQAKRQHEIEALLKQAESHWKAKRLTTPPGSNAETTYRQVLELDTGNIQARARLERIAQEYLQQARQQQSAGALQDSLELVEKGLAVAPRHKELLQLRQDVELGMAEAKARQAREAEQRLQAEQFLAQARSSFEEGALAASLAHIEQGLLAAPGYPGLLALRERVKVRMAEQARQQAELTKSQQEAEARRQAEEEAERRKAEQARQQAELVKRHQEADQYLARAVELQRKSELAASLQQIQEGLALAPNHVELLRLREAVLTQLAAEQKRQAEQARREQEIKTLLEQAEGHLKAKRLTAPAGKNARQTYRRVLELDAGNIEARAGLDRIAQEYLREAQRRRSAGALQDCLGLIDKGLAVVPDQAELLRLREEVRAEWSAEQQRLEQQRQHEQQKEQQRKEQQRLEQQRKLEQQRQEQQLQEQRRLERQQQERQRLEQRRQEEKQREQQKKLEQQQRLEEKQRQEERQRQEQQRKLEQQRQELQRLEQQRKDQQHLQQQQQEQQRKEQSPEKQPRPEPTTKPRTFGTF